jgi:exonuclease SbcD
MDKLRILHTADLHLGSPFNGSGFDAERIKQRKKDLFDCFTEILKTGQKEKVDLVIISGDLFEEDRVKRSDINQIIQNIAEIAPIRVVILPGNHDYYRAGGYYDWIPLPPNAFLFRKRTFESFEFEDLSLAIYGSAFTAPEDPERMMQQVKFIDKCKYRILAFHGSLITRTDVGNVKYRPFLEEDLSEPNADYVALGHYHKHSVIKNSKGKIIASYPGSPEPLNFGEIHEHSFNIVTIENKSVEVKTVPTALRKYLEFEIICKGVNTEKDVIAACKKAASERASEKDVVRFILKGAVDKGLIFDKDTISDELRKYYFWVKVEDSTYPDVDLEAISREETTRGSFTREMLKLIDAGRESSDMNSVERLEDALFYGLAALDGKKPEKR